MKKMIAFVLALAAALSLCACGQVAPSTQVFPEQGNPMPENTVATTEAAVEAKVLNYGDTIETENMIMTIDSADIKKELKYKKSSNFTTSRYLEEGKKAFCLMGKLENVGGDELDDDMFAGKLTVDGKYNYDLRMWCPLDLDPLSETPFYLYAEIPDKLVDSYTTATFTFGFNNDYEFTFDDVEELDNIFTLTVAK